VKGLSPRRTDAARAEFEKALPTRLPRSGVRYVITACLVGTFLDLLWEGESSFIELASGVVQVRARSETWTREDLLELTANR